MREKATLMSQNEGMGQKRKLAGAVLAATLLLNPASSSAQEVKTLGQKQDKKEVVEKTPAVAKSDSTISWDEAITGLNLEKNLEGGEISQEEIQEYVKNHKEDLIQKIKDENLDKETKAKLLEGLTENEKIQEMLEEMVNRDDIRQAVLEGNEEYIKQEISEVLWGEKVGSATISYIIGIIAGGIIIWRCKKD